MLYPSSTERVFGLESPQSGGILSKGARVGILQQVLWQTKSGPTWQTYDVAYTGMVVNTFHDSSDEATETITVLPDVAQPAGEAFASPHPRQICTKEQAITHPELGPVLLRNLVARIDLP